MKTTPWKKIKAAASPDVIAAAATRSREMLTALPLADLRRARELSQATLAELLEASQPEVSKIEHRRDLYISTLRRYIEAMGGELDIVARFPDGAVRINRFEQLEAV
jgi:DNA-binding transcriptional regulator YiaG